MLKIKREAPSRTLVYGPLHNFRGHAGTDIVRQAWDIYCPATQKNMGRQTFGILNDRLPAKKLILVWFGGLILS